MAIQKAPPLSQELMFAAAIVAGGGGIRQACARLSATGLRDSREEAPLKAWREEILAVLTEAERWGAACGVLLRQASGFVREDERRLSKAKSLEKQFAFQGAVIVVLPWAVLAISGDQVLSPLSLGGAGLQVLGLSFFSLLIRRVRSVERGEVPLLRKFCLGLWFRLQAGSSPRECLSHLTDPVPCDGVNRNWFYGAWRRWFGALDCEGSESWEWPGDLAHSESLAVALTPLIRQGAPLTEFLRSYADYLEGRRQQDWEDRLAVLPSYLSLVYCALLAPAAFLILMASVWTKISVLFT